MKLLQFTLCRFIVSILIVSILSCSSNNNWIVGKWVDESMSSLEFMHDSRVLSYIPDVAGMGSTSIIGTYKFIDNERLLITWERPNDKDVFFKYQLLDQNTLLMEVPEHSFREVFRRVEKK